MYGIHTLQYTHVFARICTHMTSLSLAPAPAPTCTYLHLHLPAPTCPFTHAFVLEYSF